MQRPRLVRFSRHGWSIAISWFDAEMRTIKVRRFPFDLPPVYGNVIAITPEAMEEEHPTLVLRDAYTRLMRDFANTDRALRASGRRGLDPSTLMTYYVAPDDGAECDIFQTGYVCSKHDHGQTLLGWKAAGRAGWLPTLRRGYPPRLLREPGRPSWP
jgi:hypothetical protein